MRQLVPLLNVESVDQSLAFYRTVLEATVLAQWESEGELRWARIGFEGGELMLNTPDGANSQARRARADFDDAVLYLMCEDAPARRAQLESAGIEVGPLRREDYGNDEFTLRDPDGYALRISSRVS